MLLVRKVAVRVHGYVVLECGVRRRDMYIRTHLLAIEREDEVRVRGSVLDGVGKNIVDVHGCPGELCGDEQGLCVVGRVGRVMPCPAQDVVRIEVYEAPVARRALLPRCRRGVRGHHTRHAVSRLVIDCPVCGGGSDCYEGDEGRKDATEMSKGIQLHPMRSWQRETSVQAFKGCVAKRAS